MTLRVVDGQFLFERDPVTLQPWMRYGRGYTPHVQEAIARILDIPSEQVLNYFSRAASVPEPYFIDLNALLEAQNTKTWEGLFAFAQENVISTAHVVVFPYLPSLDARQGERGVDALVKYVLGTPIQKYARLDELRGFDADETVREDELTRIVQEFDQGLRAHGVTEASPNLIDLNMPRRFSQR